MPKLVSQTPLRAFAAGATRHFAPNRPRGLPAKAAMIVASLSRRHLGNRDGRLFAKHLAALGDVNRESQIRQSPLNSSRWQIENPIPP
jgi:hypothetical protein